MKNMQKLDVTKLKEFENHPYKVKHDDEMEMLIESIKEHGILSPIIVRPLENDEYEIISGHRRLFAGKRAGLTEVPVAGDLFDAVEDEKLARELAEKRMQAIKEEKFNAVQKVTLDNLFSQIAQGEMKELPIIVKADVQGSAEAVKQSLEKLSNEEVRGKVIHAAVGAVNKSDVMLASDGTPFTAHSTNPVPFIVFNHECELREGGVLADIAPTMLKLLGLPQPSSMTGKSIIL